VQDIFAEFSASARADAAVRLAGVVTGGAAGLLGAHLCEHLVRQGHNVICVGNFHAGRRANI
jgi:hypothetical protein